MPTVDNELGVLPSTIAIKALSEAGYDLAEAYKMVKGKVPNERGLYAMQSKLDKLSLQQPERVSAAISAVDTILKGQLIGKVKSVSTSDILSAVRMIMDRAEPVVNVSQNTSVNVNLSPVDLDKYRTIDE